MHLRETTGKKRRKKFQAGDYNVLGQVSRPPHEEDTEPQSEECILPCPPGWSGIPTHLFIARAI